MPGKCRHMRPPSEQMVPTLAQTGWAQHVERTNTVYTGQAQCKQNKHSVHRAGTAYAGQAQRL